MKKTGILVFLLFSLAPAKSQQQAVPAFAMSRVSSPALAEMLTDARRLAQTDTAGATRLFRTVIRNAQQSGDDYTTGMAYYEMAEMNSRYNNHNKTFGGYLLARPYFDKLKAEKEIAYTLFGLGREQYYRGAFNQAANHLNYCILAARRHKLQQLEADALEYLALIYHEVPFFDMKSTPELLKVLEIRKQLNDQRGMLNLLPKIVRVYQAGNNYDSAVYYADATVKLAGELHAAEAGLAAGIMRAEVLIKQKRLEQAAAGLKMVREKLPATNNPNLVVSYNSIFSLYLLASGKDEEAMKQFRLAMQLARERDTPEAVSLLYKNVSEEYARRGDYENAYRFQKEYNNLYTKLYNIDNADRYNQSAFLIESSLAKDEVKFLATENELKRLRLLREQEIRKGLERENELMDSILRREKQLSEALQKAAQGLERENSLKNSQLVNEKKFRGAEAAKLLEQKKLKWALFAGLLAVVALGTVIFIQYRKQRRKNLIIGKQASELQTLMKEIHHRVKNNLQVVSSLLNLQSHYIRDEEALRAVKDSRNRVLSMALIHQSLYQEDNQKSVSVPDYIDKLCNSLFSSYNINPGKIKLVRDIQPMMLNPDTLMPVGLILNELLTNSLKYAFPGNRDGTVTVIVKEEANILKLRVYDNGIGVPPDVQDRQTSFGFRMIRSFIQKLKGEFRVYREGGTRAEADIHHYK